MEAQFVEALRYKSGGHGSDFKCGHWDFSFTKLSAYNTALGYAQFSRFCEFNFSKTTAKGKNRTKIWFPSPRTLQVLTLSLLMSYIYGASCKARKFNVVYIWTYVWQRWKPSPSICCTMLQHWINAESFPVSQLCVNTLPATKITLITDGI
jgi:hypothetical protein